MTDTATQETPLVKPRRAWNRHSFYMSDVMAAAAGRLAQSEHERTGRQVGAGQVIDRAMRRYVAELLTPEELAGLVNGNGREGGVS
jgi:hypothetical protein